MIGVIGCGNMASAIVVGIHGGYSDIKFLTYNPTKSKAIDLAAKVKGEAVDSLNQLKSAQTLLIGVKPQKFDELAAQLLEAGVDLKEKHIISMMASISIEAIKKKLGVSKVTRVMPNTPIFYGKGVSLILHSQEVDNELKNTINDYFRACSEVFEIESEKTFDEVTTVTGSGPAYVYLFAESFVNKLKSFGIEEKVAQKMVTGLFEGSSLLMRENSDDSLQSMIDKVTSKGGVTIEAVKKFREHEIDKITSLALDNAVKRSGELSSEFN